MLAFLENKNRYIYFWIFAIILLSSVLLSIYIGNVAPVVLPILLIGVGIAVVNYKFYYYLLFFTLPLSVEYYFGSLGTDLPTEPLMIIIAGIIFLYLIYKPEKFPGYFFIHPIACILFISFGWMVLSLLVAYDPVVSLKFILAKSWYLLAFFVAPVVFLKSVKDVRYILKLVLIPLMLTVTIVMIRHALVGFNFSEVNGLLGPAYRNHVIYAAIIVIFLPFVGFLSAGYQHKKKRFIVFAVILIIATYYSYTRAAYLALIAMALMYFIVKFRLTKVAIVGGLIIPVLLAVYLIPNNKYLDYSPDFHKTIAHYDFEDLMEATAKGEDASSMERVYRWVAAYHMIQERPLIGFGAGNFYSTYKPYTLFSFRTYVSDNPEKSGIHSYYFMTLVEQGFVGLFLFVLLMIVFFVRAEQIYHRLEDQELKSLMMACILAFTSLAVLHTLNDLVEVDKTGAFFYLCLALLIMLDSGLISKPNHREGSTPQRG